jgi:general secretion pathway protein K
MKLRLARKCRNESGIALIIVMISILVLGLLAGRFAYSMKVETTLARNANSEMELEWIGRSGVEYARWILVQQASCPAEPYDALSQIWAGGSSGPCATNAGLSEVQKEFQLGRGSFTWKITDLESKFNINSTASPGGEQILQQGLLVMGVDAGDMGPIVSSIQDWIDDNDQTRMQGAENEFYHTLPSPYEAKNGPIDDLSELLLVKEITPEIYWGNASTNRQSAALRQLHNKFAKPDETPSYACGLVDLFTPISSGRININTASSEVLQLIPGIDPPTADAIVAGRQGEDDGSGMLGPYPTVDAVRRLPEVNPFVINALRQYGATRSTAFQVTVDAKIGSYTRQFVAILGRSPGNPRDVQILNFYWK